MRIINGKILTMENSIIERGYIEFNNGHITSIGDMDEIDINDNDFDADYGYILPGFIDAHTCLGLKEESHRFEGVDWNENSSPITPQIDAFDGFNPLDGAICHALDGGVTTVISSQGNMNLIGGKVVAMKLGKTITSEMVLKRPCAIKFSLGEEPKRAYGTKGKAPVTRMAEVAMLRQTLFKARKYYENRFEDMDNIYENFIPLFRKEIPAYFHAQRSDDIVTALRLSKEFDFKCVIVHGVESYKVAEQIKEADACVIVGPLVITNYSYETRHAGIHIPAKLYRKKVPFCITTDHYISPIEFLSVSAALSVREGLPKDIALRSITINAAKIAGVSDRVGSLVTGKDADISIFSKHPFEYNTQLVALFIDGMRIR